MAKPKSRSKGVKVKSTGGKGKPVRKGKASSKTSSKTKGKPSNRKVHSSGTKKTNNRNSQSNIAFAGNDKFLSREQDKYDSPVPSREFIIEYMEYIRVPVKRSQIAEALGVEDSAEAQEAFRRRIKAMIRDGQVLKNRNGYYVLVNSEDLIKGKILGHPDGYGYCLPEDGSERIFLPPKKMRQVLHNDSVIVRVTGFDRNGGREGSVVETLERANSTIVGRFLDESGFGVVVPENKRISQEILIPRGKNLNAKDGQIVVVSITSFPTSHSQPVGEVVEILGDYLAAGMEIDIASRVFDIPVVWPIEVEAQIEKIKTHVLASHKKDRVDIREFPLVTIDGEDARDFDDAVFCKPTSTGWKLYVAIADVSHYVKPDTPLDDEAKNRGTSVYFPGSVIAMLPEKLSNGLCSLKPKVDRLCMVCEMIISKDGKVSRSRFYKAVMRSAARLTYTEVASILIDKDEELSKKRKDLLEHLENLWDVYKVLRKQRGNRGAIDFDTVETQIIFNEERKIEKIVPYERNEAHMLIEECMIAANVCSANFLLKHKIPALYRDHEPPSDRKLEMLYQYIGRLGLSLDSKGDVPSPNDYNQFLTKIREREDFSVLQTVLLRSLSQAEYRPENSGHFGLALESYAHFTSPIRRYPDLLVHRAIGHILSGGNGTNYIYSNKSMENLGSHCSMTERRADEATRDVDQSLKCQYVSGKIGEEFDGIISGVTSFGIFVEIVGVYVEGLVHVTDLGNDYYHYDPARQCMVGERTRKKFALGDKLRISVSRVDVDEKKIDFSLV